MYYRQTINSVIESVAPRPRKPRLSEDQIEKLKRVSEVALVAVAVGGVLTLANIFMAIDKLFFKKNQRKPDYDERKQIAARTIYYLRTQKYISMKFTGRDFRVKLTRLGRKRVGDLEFETLSVQQPKSWNHKWWQVAADIPTKKFKSYADVFREKLKGMNFFPLQRTLWYYPYDPREEIELIANNYNIANFVTVMEVSRLDFDDEKKMIRHFKKRRILS